MNAPRVVERGKLKTFLELTGVEDKNGEENI
jgi:hypothetical protein